MFRMDSQLEERLKLWHKQIDTLSGIEETYLTLEATEKSLFGKLFLKAEGKSVAEREAVAYSSEDWETFKKALAHSKSRYLTEKRNLELKIKAYEATYLSYKIENEAIKKGIT